MSRLSHDDIKNIGNTLQSTDDECKLLTGVGLREIAMNAAGFSLSENAQHRSVKCAVVPITSGQGIISQFSETVAAILTFLGADAYVTTKSDVTGIAESYRKSADIIFFADDDTFSAICTSKNIISDNGTATGNGFAEALSLAYFNSIINENIHTKPPVLVLGAGPVGRAAATYLTKKDIPVFIYDTYIGRAKKNQIPGVFVLDKCDLHCFKYILCAANSGSFIYKKDITPGTFISAPGMPLCLADNAKSLVKLFHNPLELGVAVMYYECMKGIFHE